MNIDVFLKHWKIQGKGRASSEKHPASLPAPGCSCCLLHTSAGCGGGPSQGHWPSCLCCVRLCCIHTGISGSLQDEVRPADVPLQCSCLCGALPFGTLCQAWQLTCASRSSPSSQHHSKGSSLQHRLSPALCFLMPPATPPSPCGEQLPEEAGNQDRPPVDAHCLQVWSILFKYAHDST